MSRFLSCGACALRQEVSDESGDVCVRCGPTSWIDFPDIDLEAEDPAGEFVPGIGRVTWHPSMGPPAPVICVACGRFYTCCAC